MQRVATLHSLRPSWSFKKRPSGLIRWKSSWATAHGTASKYRRFFLTMVKIWSVSEMRRSRGQATSTSMENSIWQLDLIINSTSVQHTHLVFLSHASLVLVELTVRALLDGFEHVALRCLQLLYLVKCKEYLQRYVASGRLRSLFMQELILWVVLVAEVVIHLSF